jgi:hypothetical protein
MWHRPGQRPAPASCVLCIKMLMYMPHIHRRAEKKLWDKEASEHNLEPCWYGRQVTLKGHQFRVFGFGKDEATGRTFVRGRTAAMEEVRVGADHVRVYLQVGCRQPSPAAAGAHTVATGGQGEAGSAGGVTSPPDSVGAVASGTSVSSGASQAGCTSGSPCCCQRNNSHASLSPNFCSSEARICWEQCGSEAPLARLSHVLVKGCKLMTIRGTKMLEGTKARVFFACTSFCVP